MPVIVPQSFTGIPDPLFTRGTRNGDPPVALSVRRIIDGMNHCAGQGRIVFCQAWDPGETPNLVGNLVLARFRYFERNNNGKVLKFGAILLPRNTAIVAATSPALDDNGTDVITHEWMDASPSYPSEAAVVVGQRTIAPGGGEVDHTITVQDGFACVALIVWEQPAAAPPFRLDGTDHHVTPTAALAGNPITTTVLADLRETGDEIYNRIREVLNHHGPQEVNTADGYLVNSATMTNLIDGTTGARSATGGGIPVHARDGARGFGTYVTAHVAVYAERTAGAGTLSVEFVSSLNTVTVTLAGAGPAWSASSNTLQIATGTNVDGLGRDWDLVAVRASAPAGTTFRIYGWHLEIEP